VDAAVYLGRVWVGDTGAAFFGVTAARTGPVTLLHVRTDHPELTASWEGGDGARISHGLTLPVRVAWTPRGPSALDAVIVVETDVEGSQRLEVRAMGEASAPPDCDDANPCTVDRFDRSDGHCLHSVREGTCDDGNACTADDRCVAGSCLGVGRRCDDDDVCTLNLCDPAIGCIHPPDGRRCDDGDPCTADLCDREDGCTHPDAPDGTACGALSCAEAHVCVFGACRALDVRGLSDGFPCSDADPCTEGDACLAGACASGPRVRREPSVAATFETFGGRGSLPGTDGYRYLFAEDNVLVAAVREGDATLRRTATLPVASSVPPVYFKPGRMLVARADILYFVDMSDPAAPRVAWELPLAGVGMAGAGPVEHIVRVRGGAVVATAMPTDVPRSVLVFVPVADSNELPGTPVALSIVEFLEDLDGDGDYLAAATGYTAHWMQLSAEGNQAVRRLLRDVTLNGTAAKVSVRGNRIATSYGGDTLVVSEVDPGTGALPVPCDGTSSCGAFSPGCSGPVFPPGSYRTCLSEQPACPADTHCARVSVAPDGSTCAPGDLFCCAQPYPLCVSDPLPRVTAVATVSARRARDIVLDSPWVYWTGPEGTFAEKIDGNPPNVTPRPRMQVDTMPATRLDRAPFHLLASGAVALPLAKREDPSAPAPSNQILPDGVVRVTGPGHGDMVVATHGEPGKVVLAGPAAVGEIDLAARGYASHLTVSASGPERPRVLATPLRTLAVDDDVHEDVRYAGAPGALDTPGAPLDSVGPAGAQTSLPVTGMHAGSLDAACGRLWSSTYEWSPDLTQSVPPKHLRVWSLDPFQAAPADDLAIDRGEVWWPARVRAAENGGGAVLLERGLESGLQSYRLRVFDCGAAPVAPHRSFTVQGVQETELPRRDLVALAPPLLLLSTNRQARLFDLLPSDPVQRATWDLPEARTINLRIAALSADHAWVTYQTIDASGDSSETLAQLAWNGAASLESLGSTTLPGRPRKFFDAGPFGVVTTPRAVAVVLPACR